MKTRLEGRRLVMRTARLTILWNLALAGFKLFAGVYARSGALVSDACHSASDVLSTAVVMVGARMAGKAPDRDHPYGHERMECVAAILLAAVLLAAGLGAGCAALRGLLGGTGRLAAPGRLALAAAAISVAVKEGMFRYTRSAAERAGSSALMADAWHHRSDALSSVGSFAGVLGARMGFPALDPAAGLLISGMICWAAARIFIDAVGRMTDHACGEEEVREIAGQVLRQREVRGIDRLDTRLFGDRVYVDVEIRADGELSLNEAHAAAQRVHDAVEARFPRVKHCMVHVNPEDTGRTA